MLLLYRGKPLLHSSSSADNKYGSMCLSLELAPVDFGPGEDKALRRGGNDAVKPLVIPFCRLQEIQFMSEADRLGLAAKGFGKKCKKADVHVVKREVIPNSTRFWEGYCKPWQ